MSHGMCMRRTFWGATSKINNPHETLSKCQRCLSYIHTLELPFILQDQHLDRLGGILRSLRVPPPDGSIPSNAAVRNIPARQSHPQQLRDWRQHNQQDREQEDGRQIMGATGWARSRTSSQSAQTETPAMAPPLHASRREQQEAGRGSVHKGAAPDPPQYQCVGDSDEDSRTASSVRGPAAPSSTAVPSGVPPGDADAETGRRGGGDGNKVPTKGGTLLSLPLPLPLLRERAVRAWWRGLSCGVCFAAGGWAREGHGVFGALLALVAVCGETMLHHVA